MHFSAIGSYEAIFLSISCQLSLFQLSKKDFFSVDVFVYAFAKLSTVVLFRRQPAFRQHIALEHDFSVTSKSFRKSVPKVPVKHGFPEYEHTPIKMVSPVAKSIYAQIRWDLKFLGVSILTNGILFYLMLRMD